MRIAFAGTPEFAIPSLHQLVQNHTVVGVICQPDRVAGRGRKLHSCAVKKEALRLGLPVYQPESIVEIVEQLRLLSLDMMVVVAYGQILSSVLLNIPRLGCVNVHASLLPRWRGAAPIARAIEAGDKITGISIMQMTEGLDDGGVLDSQSVDIGEDNADQLSEKLAHMGADLLISTLQDFDLKRQNITQQDKNQVTYAKKLSKEEAEINWQQGAIEIIQTIRAFNPFPVCFTHIFAQRVRIFDARQVRANHLPNDAKIGDIMMHKKQLYIRCRDGWISPLIVQPMGKKPMSISAFLNGIRQF